MNYCRKCHSEAEELFRCAECREWGCDMCIPGGKGSICLDCEEGYLSGDDDDRGYD